MTLHSIKIKKVITGPYSLDFIVRNMLPHLHVIEANSGKKTFESEEFFKKFVNGDVEFVTENEHTARFISANFGGMNIEYKSFDPEFQAKMKVWREEHDKKMEVARKWFDTLSEEHQEYVKLLSELYYD